MAATKLQANWTGVTWNANAITRVTQASFSHGGQLQSFSADTDHYPTVIANLMNKPTATITTADIGTIMATAFGSGVAGTLSATHADALGATGGAIVYTLANACVGARSGSGSHNAWGSGSITFEAFSSDGTTNPLSIARV